MKSFIETIKICQSASGAGSKKIIMEALKKLSPDARKLMNYVFNPYITFGIKKYPKPKKYAQTDSDVDLIFYVLDSLKNRELTGNAAKEAVILLMQQFTEETATYIGLIIEKNLRSGFSVETYNKVWPNEQIPVFNVMLADKCDDGESIDDMIDFPCYGEIKLDGERTIAIVKPGESVVYYSRSGLLATHCFGLFDDELQKLREDMGGNPIVVDGERFAGDFTTTQNAKKGDNQDAKNSLKFYCFFIMPLDDWYNQKTNITMQTNLNNINTHIKFSNRFQKLVVPNGKMLYSAQDVKLYTDEVTTPGFDGLADGQEGLILKSLNNTYEWDRVATWIKVKKFHDCDGIITGIYQGRPGSRLQNTLGGIYFKGRLESGMIVESRVGSGFTDSLREEIFNNPEMFINKSCVIKYQNISKAKNKNIHSLRFCTFEHFRDDKPMEFDDE